MVGFLGDKTAFAAPQIVELGKNVAWAWDDPPICKDVEAMKAFYTIPDNGGKFWVPPDNAPRVRTVCPRMLALPPDCVAFCAETRRPPIQLFTYITDTLRHSRIDPRHYDLAIDWCCMAAHPGMGVNTSSSILSFAMPTIMGSTEHLFEWAHNRLAVTLTHREKDNQPCGLTGQRREQYAPPDRNTQHTTTVDPGVLAQVTAAVVAAFRASGGPDNGEGTARGSGKAAEEAKAYSEFQLSKLKGFCCVHTDSRLPTIWEYFRTTKEVDTQRTQLLEEMTSWARHT